MKCSKCGRAADYIYRRVTKSGARATFYCDLCAPFARVHKEGNEETFADLVGLDENGRHPFPYGYTIRRGNIDIEKDFSIEELRLFADALEVLTSEIMKTSDLSEEERERFYSPTPDFDERYDWD